MGHFERVGKGERRAFRRQECCSLAAESSSVGCRGFLQRAWLQRDEKKRWQERHEQQITTARNCCKHKCGGSLDIGCLAERGERKGYVSRLFHGQTLCLLVCLALNMDSAQSFHSIPLSVSPLPWDIRHSISSSQALMGRRFTRSHSEATLKMGLKLVHSRSVHREPVAVQGVAGWRTRISRGRNAISSIIAMHAARRGSSGGESREDENEESSSGDLDSSLDASWQAAMRARSPRSPGRQGRGVLRDAWNDKQGKRVLFPHTPTEAVSQAADAVEHALDQGIFRLRVQMNLDEFDLNRQTLSQSSLPRLINSLAFRCEAAAADDDEM